MQTRGTVSKQLLLVIVALCMTLLAVSFFGLRKFARVALSGRNNDPSIQLDSKKYEIRIELPSDEFVFSEAPEFSEGQAGIPLYPSAHPKHTGLQVAVKHGVFCIYSFETPDPVERVAAFYRGKLNERVTQFTMRGPRVTISVQRGAKGYAGMDIEPQEQTKMTRIGISFYCSRPRT